MVYGKISASCYHTALALNYRNWPNNFRGLAVGIPVAFFGLAAFLYSSIVSHIFQLETPQGTILDVAAVLFFLGSSVFILNVLGALGLHDLMNMLEYEQEVVISETQPLLRGPIQSDESLNTSTVFQNYSGMYSSQRDMDLMSDVTSIPIPIELEDISCLNFLEAYILAYCMFSLVGVSLMYINNVGSISKN